MPQHVIDAGTRLTEVLGTRPPFDPIAVGDELASKIVQTAISDSSFLTIVCEQAVAKIAKFRPLQAAAVVCRVQWRLGNGIGVGAMQFSNALDKEAVKW